MALVLVGRGSYDESATAEMHELARLRHDLAVSRTTEVCFLAMASPRLEKTLATVAARGFQRVVVQPHLLFAGDLADTLQRSVAEMRLQAPNQEWLLAPLLADPQDSPVGGNQFLLGVITDRLGEAIRVVASGREG
jgi:sirohydrochlorin ferrochelatase